MFFCGLKAGETAGSVGDSSCMFQSKASTSQGVLLRGVRKFLFCFSCRAGGADPDPRRRLPFRLHGLLRSLQLAEAGRCAKSHAARGDQKRISLVANCTTPGKVTLLDHGVCVRNCTQRCDVKCIVLARPESIPKCPFNFCDLHR